MMSQVQRLLLSLSVLWVLVTGVSAAPAEVKRQTFTYKTVGKLEIQADVYRPDDRKVRPVVVWIHGGALIVGSRRGIPTRLRRFCQEQGAILVSLDYRLAPEVQVPAILEDIKDAFTWIREQGPKLFQADPRRILVSGGSAGGYLTLMTGIHIKPAPRALVAYWGYGDVDGDWYTKPSPYYRKQLPLIPREEAEKAVGHGVLTNTDESQEIRQARGRYYRYLRQNGLWTRIVTGFDPQRERRKLDPFCPVRNVTSAYPPTLLVHGTKDNDVPYEQSANMARALERNKVPHELITVKGAGHGLAGGDPQAVEQAHRKALQFLGKYLR
jgi:acetyl esterase/lipase